MSKIDSDVKDIVAIRCTLCKKTMEKVAKNNKCPHCSAASRQRMLPYVVNGLKDDISLDLVRSKPLLSFAMTSQEKEVLSTIFPSFASTSLYGNYGKDHIEGCDVRDLSRFEDNSFCGVFSILLFDYFAEHEKALVECARVTAPGGVFIASIAEYRLVDNEMTANINYIIQPRADYFQYIPSDANMPSIKVGRPTFVNYMRNAGYHAAHWSIQDPASGEKTDWFIGFVPE